MPVDKEEFFKKQIEECRELERLALSAKDRAFWQQAAGRWKEQLRQAQETSNAREAAEDTNTTRALSADGLSGGPN
jgi:hypothetical protein